MRTDKTTPPSGETDRENKKSSAAGKLAAILAETLLLLALAAAAVLLTIAHGPSESARRDLSALVAERGTLGRLAADYLGGAAAESAPLPAPTAAPEGKSAEQSETPAESGASAADPWGLTDEDGDGIIFCPVYGRGFTGTMMVVLDPMRVTVGFMPDRVGSRGRAASWTRAAPATARRRTAWSSTTGRSTAATAARARALPASTGKESCTSASSARRRSSKWASAGASPSAPC